MRLSSECRSIYALVSHVSKRRFAFTTTATAAAAAVVVDKTRGMYRRHMRNTQPHLLSLLPSFDIPWTVLLYLASLAFRTSLLSQKLSNAAVSQLTALH